MRVPPGAHAESGTPPKRWYVDPCHFSHAIVHVVLTFSTSGTSLPRRLVSDVGDSMTGHLVQRGPNKWALVLNIGDGASGYKQKWVSFKGGKRAAQAELARLIAQAEAPSAAPEPPPSTMTLAEWLERWLDIQVQPHARVKTYDMWSGLVRSHIVPALGSTPLTDLSPLSIQGYYRRKLQGDRRDGKPGGLSPQTVRHLHTILHAALQQAKVWDIVTENVLDRVTPPRVPKSSPKTWTAEETAKFLFTAAEHWAYPIVLLAALAGMRRGEVFGLKWRAVDLARGTLSVVTTLIVTDSGGSSCSRAGRQLAVLARSNCPRSQSLPY